MIGSTTTWFVGNMYEVTDGAVTKYYYAAVLSASGTLVSQQRYMPFGQVRTSVGSITQTDFGYAGQRKEGYTGLMDYKARWYDPELGRFVQADSIVPPGVQGLDRYAGMANNPLRYTDPTGHDPYYCSTPNCEANILNRKKGGSPSNPSGYMGFTAAQWAKANVTNKDSISCPPGTKCTCFAATAVNSGYVNPLFANENDPSYYQVLPFITKLKNPSTHNFVEYQNHQDHNPDGSLKQFTDEPNKNYANYGALDGEESWTTFIKSKTPKLELGDIVGYQNANTSSYYNHVAMVVGFAPNPDHANAPWPQVVDVDGSIPEAQQPRFLDTSPSRDINKVILIFVGR